MKSVTVYTTDTAPCASSAKMLLGKRSIAYEEINLAQDPDGRAKLAELTGMFTFPQIVIDGETLGGFDELLAADRAGRLIRDCSRPRRRTAAAPRPRLAALAHVGPPAADHELADRRPQRGHGSPSRRWTRNRSWNDPRAPSTWRKSSIVAPLASIPASSASSIAVAQRGQLARRQRAGRAQRVDPGPEQRLVGVDVPHAGDPALVEHERLDRRASGRGPWPAGARAVNSGVSGSIPIRCPR